MLSSTEKAKNPSTAVDSDDTGARMPTVTDIQRGYLMTTFEGVERQPPGSFMLFAATVDNVDELMERSLLPISALVSDAMQEPVHVGAQLSAGLTLDGTTLRSGDLMTCGLDAPTQRTRVDYGRFLTALGVAVRSFPPTTDPQPPGTTLTIWNAPNRPEASPFNRFTIRDYGRTLKKQCGPGARITYGRPPEKIGPTHEYRESLANWRSTAPGGVLIHNDAQCLSTRAVQTACLTLQFQQIDAMLACGCVKCKRLLDEIQWQIDRE